MAGRYPFAADYPKTDQYGQVRLPSSMAPDTGDSNLNAIMRASNARQRMADYNRLVDDQDRQNGTITPFWARQQLSSMGNSLGDQLVEAQNEIADTGQRTRTRFDTRGPALMGGASAPMSYTQSENNARYAAQVGPYGVFGAGTGGAPYKAGNDSLDAAQRVQNRRKR